MKFNLLKAGDRFIYQGEIYFKSTPLVAINEASGNSKLIPRSALLQHVEANNSPSTTEPDLDFNIQKHLSENSELFTSELGKILTVGETDKLAIQKIYEEVSAELISKILP